MIKPWHLKTLTPTKTGKCCMFNKIVNVLRFDTSLCHLHSPIYFPVFFRIFPYVSHFFPGSHPVGIPRAKTPVPKRRSTAANQAPTPRRTATSFSTGLAQKDASKTSPKRDEVLRQSKIWRCFEYQHITK